MQTHFEMVDAVNDAVTDDEHRLAKARLAGWRMGVEWSGVDADLHSMARFKGERPMCCGVLLDWKPKEQDAISLALEVLQHLDSVSPYPIGRKAIAALQRHNAEITGLSG